MNKKLIVIITTGWFPEGDAGAVRLRMMGKALCASGYSVTVLCRGKDCDSGCIEGIQYKSLRTNSKNSICKFIDYSLFPTRTKKYLNDNKILLNAVYIYNAQESIFKYCKRFCKKNDVNLYHDCVEWYSPEEYRLGKYDPWYRVKERINSRIIDKNFKVVAITNYLCDYFSSKGISAIRVPILCDSESRTFPKEMHEDDCLTIFYGGLPGTKDLVGNLLSASLMLSEKERKHLRIIIAGAGYDYLKKVSGISAEVLDGCSDYLTLCGRIPRKDVLHYMEKADFAFLARNSELRYARAGFPSKIVEALANATPVICNISSDLGEYLVNGYNAILCENHEPESIRDALRIALTLSSEKKHQMSINALKTAKDSFDYHSYVSVLSDFFS